jgi:type IV secretion system protein VirB6
MMAGFCPGLPADGPFLTNMLGYIDCQSALIGRSGYQALATSGSATALMLTGVLTVFIALFGYRMLLGAIPGARESVIAVVKIGIVLMLATNWPAYQTLVYDVVLRAPGELASSVAQSASLSDNTDGVLITGLQRLDGEMALLQQLGAGNPQFSNQTATPATGPIGTPQLQQSTPAWDPQRDRQVLANARTVYLVATVVAFGSVRLIGGIMLALGPLFVLFLLFGATRGVLEGWIRVLGGAALGGLGTAIVLALELAFIDPWLPIIIAQRQAEIALPALPVELMSVTLVFALFLLATLLAAARVAQGFHFPVAWAAAAGRLLPQSSALRPADRALADGRHEADTSNAPQTRAQGVANSVATLQRREGYMPQGVTNVIERTSGPRQPSAGYETMAVPPLGQSFRRRTQGRISAGAGRRDRPA